MKIIVEIPNKEIKSVAAKLSLALGLDYPEGTMEKIDETSELDVTDIISQEKDAFMGFAMMAVGKIIEPIENGN